MPTPSSPLLWWEGFPVAFLLTCAVELPAYVLAFAALGWCRLQPSPYRPLTVLTALALALAVNLITHPMLWAVSLQLGRTDELLAAELAVALVEALLIFVVVRRNLGRDSAGNRLGWSLMSAVGINTLSLLVGLVLLPTIVRA